MAAKKIFILDDSEQVLLLSESVLKSAGFEVHTAMNVEAMAKELGSYRPDLLLIDVMMPQGFGFDLVEYLREQLKVPGKIILFSSMEPTELAQHAARSGADGYIHKNERLDLLISEVHRFLGL
jgi:DNA-binding response OmpR family regulator